MSGKKNILFIALVLLAVFLLTIIHCSTVSAAKLENIYPNIPGAVTPTTTETPLPVLFKYLYNLSIILAGVIAFVVTVWGGIRYILAGPQPGKLTDAREQIALGFVGMIIIFGSYVIVNTINPDFTKLTVILPVNKFTGTLPPPSDTSNIDIGLFEIPVGSIITSEFGASSFLATTSPDIDYANTEWPSATTSTSTYDTDFQGALFGARLRRVYEVASTTVPAAQKLHDLSTELKDLTDDCTCMYECQGNFAIVCETDENCGCDEGYLCSDDTKDKMKEKITEIGSLKDAFKAFLNPNSLVKDYYNNNQSDIDGLDDNEIKDIIQTMIEVENKGGYSPKTDLLERDVGRNLFEMTFLINDMKKIKRMLNPYDQDVGFLSLLTFAEATTLESTMDVSSTIYNYYVTFASGLEKIDEKNDPATFYSAATLPYPYGPPGTQPYNQNIPEPDLLQYLDKQKISYPENIAFADEPYTPPDVKFNFDTPPTTGGVCNYIVEIPIGRALDEAIKLAQAINKELFNIFIKGQAEIIGANMLIKAAEKFADLKCADGCIQPKCLEELGVPGCVPPSIVLLGWKCYPNGETVLLNAYTGIAMDLIKLTTIPGINLALDDIETSFKKLDSQEPILTDYVCPDIEGNCLSKDGTVQDDKIEKREYTLKDKLIEVQLLLDRSRELVGQAKEKSVYEILLEDYIALDLGEYYKNLLDYIRGIDSINKTDLQDCHIMSGTIKKIEGKNYSTSLMNCRDAKLLDLIDFHDKEVCSPNPYLDANFYLNPDARALRPISCYCYDEDADKNYYNKSDFPELYQSVSLVIPSFAADIEDLDADALQDMANQWQDARIDLNNFAGFGNDYFCCIKNYEE
ncbi:pilin [Patescibacteria group bacterium]|nr:pilin [Patescibacteria group bacterium]